VAAIKHQADKMIAKAEDTKKSQNDEKEQNKEQETGEGDEASLRRRGGRGPQPAAQALQEESQAVRAVVRARGRRRLAKALQEGG